MVLVNAFIFCCLLEYIFSHLAVILSVIVHRHRTVKVIFFILSLYKQIIVIKDYEIFLSVRITSLRKGKLPNSNQTTF